MWINTLKIVLWCLICVGLYGASSVSYTTITGTAPCPRIIGIPACFVVFIGYALMLIATLTQNHTGKIFLMGWVPVFLLAFVGSMFEIGNGNTCPKSSFGLALCYVSLAFATMVAFCFFIIKKQRLTES